MRVALLLLLLVACAQVEAQAQWVKPYLRIETGAHAAKVSRIDVDGAERFLVSASEDKTARVWDLSSGRLLITLRPPVGDDKDGMLYAVAFSPDGATLAVGGFTGANRSGNYRIYIFDRESGAIRHTITDLPRVIDALAYSKDGRYLAAGIGGGNGIRVFEATGYAEVARDEEYGDDCYGLEFDQSGKLVAASIDGFVRLYNHDFRLLHKEQPPHGKEPYLARFSHNGKLIAVGFHDTQAVDVLSGENLSFEYTIQPPGTGNLGRPLWSTDGRTLCAAGQYETTDGVNPVLCWGERGKGGLSTFSVARDTIADIHALRDGAIAFCAGAGDVGVLDPSGVMRWRVSPDLLDYRDVSFPRVSSDGNKVEVASPYLSGTTSKQHRISFSVSDQMLQIDTEPNPLLLGPVTTGIRIDQWYDNEHPVLDGHVWKLTAHETFRSLAISPNKDSFVFGTDFFLRKFDRQGGQIWRPFVPGVAWGVNITADGRFVVAALGDGTVRWYTFDKGDEVLALFVDSDLKRWVAWSPIGFFTFEGGGDALIGYQINRGPNHEGDFVKVDQLREVFYRPDLIAQILKPGGQQAVLEASNHIGDISKILSGGLPPEIELISPAQETVEGEYLLQFRLKDMGGGRGRVVYRVDGREIEGRGVTDFAGTGTDVISRYIPVGNGSSTLSVAAYNASGKIECPPTTIRITRNLPSPKSNLYVIAAGVSHYKDQSLREGVRFASADADLVAARFKEQEGRGLYGKVTAVSLPDSQATISKIQDTVAQAANAVRPGDTFVLYLAGHGEAVDGEYYFIPYEAENTSQQEVLKKSLSREAIQGFLKQIHTTNSVLILDTCGAGAYLEDRGADEKGAIDKLALMSGNTVLAASDTKEMALEGYENHGVFTFALLEGLQKADVNEKGDVLTDSLGMYLRNTVPRITNDRWHLKQSPHISYRSGEPFPIARKLAD